MVESTKDAINRMEDIREQSVLAVDVNAAIEQDIVIMSKETGTASFSYGDIHNSKVDNELHYDYKMVIDGYAQMHEITPIDAEKRLLKLGVLRPMPNGEYSVEVGHSTRSGGGRNYDGTIFFAFSNNSKDTRYHELAHSYQRKYNLFDDDTIDKMYALSEKGLENPLDKKRKFVSPDRYKLYLKETHAMIFAQSALMLRQETRADFLKQAVYARSVGDVEHSTGVLMGALHIEGSDFKKLYACRAAMYAATREVAAIRKNGKRGEYFNADGSLNGKKLSDLCEKIVFEKAYSPRTYRAFIDGNVLDGHSEKENGWRRDTLSALGKALPAKVINFFGKDKIKIEKIRHSLLKKKEIKLLEKMTSHREKNDDPQKQAVSDYQYIQARLSILASKSFYVNADDFLKGMLRKMGKYAVDDSIGMMATDVRAAGAFEELSNIYSIVCANKSNPYFRAIMENPANIVDARNGKLVVSEQEKTSETQAPEKPLDIASKMKMLRNRGRGNY